MKNVSAFQLGLLILFSVAIVVAMLIFGLSGREPKDEIGLSGSVTIWGTFDRPTFDAFLNSVASQLKIKAQLTYVQKSPATYERDLVEALAIGQAPDLFLLSQDSILKNKNKIASISYESIPLRTFRDTFVEESDLFTDTNGIIAMPFAVDPFVMYWNRTMFSSSGLVAPPKYWDEFYQTSEVLTKRDTTSNILQSVVALGEYDNINHAKELIITLIMQAGNPVIERRGAGLQAVLNENFGFQIPPASSALRFFTEFSNPVSPVYSWNRSLPSSQQAFLNARLATYFGFASELSSLQTKNPNLNFDVTFLPQARDIGSRLTFGKMYAFAIPKNASNYVNSFYAATTLTSAPAVKIWQDVSGLPSVRRDSISSAPDNPHRTVFQESAIIARGWLDPDPIASERILSDTIAGIFSGRLRTEEAVGRANLELQGLLDI